MNTLPAAPTDYQHFINGQFTDGHSSERLERHSPGHRDVVVSRYLAGTAADAEDAIRAARTHFDEGPWPWSKSAERQQVLHRTAELIRRDADELGLIECLESGKPIKQARGEMGAAAAMFDYAAALARHLYGETCNNQGEGFFGMTVREPAGVVAMITPWNFPLVVLCQKLPFALAAGCTCVIKPSEFTSGTSVRLMSLLKEAGLPDGACNLVTGHGVPVGEALVTSPKVDMVSFTGSTAVGQRIGSLAGEGLKKVALELGGKNPQLIFADTDLDEVVDAVVFGVYFNMGECCVSGSKILVEESIADELVARVTAAAQTVPMGDPLDETVKVGAIINDRQQEKILGYLEQAKAEGATVALGGGVHEQGNGRFVQLTILDHVTPEMSVARGEIFGPVLSVLRFQTEEEAVRLANDTTYGLSASIWTKDLDRALRLSRRVQAGTVWVNTYMQGAMELPFGGYKQSGIGREFGAEAVLDFTEVKNVSIRLGAYQKRWL
ncbi:MAG: aldehyde dehydrogenase family protein [Verrucomicrobiota bacterium]